MTKPASPPASTPSQSCESCSMPIETGRYCVHCTDERGELQPFEERFARMVSWQQRRHPEQSRADAENATVTWMATLPAWKDHPEVQARLARRAGR